MSEPGSWPFGVILRHDNRNRIISVRDRALNFRHRKSGSHPWRTLAPDAAKDPMAVRIVRTEFAPHPEMNPDEYYEPEAEMRLQCIFQRNAPTRLTNKSSTPHEFIAGTSSGKVKANFATNAF